MKKIFYVAALALAVGAVSCDNAKNASEDKYFSTEATDSLTSSFGEAAGIALNMQILNAMKADPTISKAEYIKGVQYAMAADTSDAYINGMIAGLQLQTQIKKFESMGLKVNTSTVLNGFKKTFLPDSLPSQFEMAAIEGVYRAWTDSLARAKRAYDTDKLMNSPESQENLEKGAAYIKDKAASNDSVKISASGLGYKIIDPGTGEKPAATQRVILTYTARTADGRVVEQYNDAPMALSTRTPGLREGVTMLGKGGKAELYVPGNLAYGVEAPQRYDLGLNELLVYEVELVDVPNGVNPGLK